MQAWYRAESQSLLRQRRDPRNTTNVCIRPLAKVSIASSSAKGIPRCNRRPGRKVGAVVSIASSSAKGFPPLPQRRRSLGDQVSIASSSAKGFPRCDSHSQSWYSRCCLNRFFTSEGIPTLAFTVKNFGTANKSQSLLRQRTDSHLVQLRLGRAAHRVSIASSSAARGFPTAVSLQPTACLSNRFFVSEGIPTNKDYANKTGIGTSQSLLRQRRHSHVMVEMHPATIQIESQSLLRQRRHSHVLTPLATAEGAGKSQSLLRQRRHSHSVKKPTVITVMPWSQSLLRQRRDSHEARAALADSEPPLPQSLLHQRRDSHSGRLREPRNPDQVSIASSSAKGFRPTADASLTVVCNSSQSLLHQRRDSHVHPYLGAEALQPLSQSVLRQRRDSHLSQSHSFSATRGVSIASSSAKGFESAGARCQVSGARLRIPPAAPNKPAVRARSPAADSPSAAPQVPGLHPPVSGQSLLRQRRDSHG